MTAEYDAADRLLREVQTFQGRSQVLSYAYDRLDRRISSKLDEKDEVGYEWDLANRLTAIHYAGQATRYSWDAAGRLLKKTLPNGITADYGYDAANRLLSIDYKKADGSRIDQLSYSYDARGQRSSKSVAAQHLGVETPMTAEYDAADRMSRITLRPGQPGRESCVLSYDANGNLAEKACDGASGTTRYGWDSLNKLAIITGPGLNAGFAYDALGRRVSRTLNGEVTWYSYDGEQAIAETKSGVTTRLLTGLAVDELIATYTQGQQRVMLSDALGSILGETRADGSRATTRTYSPYGETSHSGEAPSSSTAYTGREQDSGNLYYYRARFYDPQLKRFTQSDPIGLEGCMNTYAYADGSPTMKTDPLGLATFMCTKPLHALGGEGSRSGPDIWGNPLYHQYLCINDGKGGYTCGGQDQRGQKWYDPISGPGKPSNDKYDPQTCEQKEPDNNCIEQCLVKKFAGPRPRYGIPFGTDCQEWSDDALKDCQKQCKKK